MSPSCQSWAIPSNDRSGLPSSRRYAAGAEPQPETAAKVHHETVNIARAADSADIWRLLWSYNEEQLKTASNQLIKYLDHDQLNVRVLAYANLVTITGMFGSYLPERPAAQRRPA